MGALFLLGVAVCLLLGTHVHPMARMAGAVQILVSASAVSAGVALFWLAVTFVFGRLYCASVCPVGVLSDIFLRVRRRIPRLNRPFTFRARSRLDVPLLWIYVVCVMVGLSVVVFAVQPYNITRNMASAVRPALTEATWGTLGLGAAVGIATGVVSFIIIAVTSLLRGREFCTRWCPLGTALGIVQERALMHIEFDPDRCRSCGLCEARCRAQAIKMVSRYVDQTRCVRCFDCVADCPNGAIKYQLNRNRPASPLMRKVGSKQ